MEIKFKELFKPTIFKIIIFVFLILLTIPVPKTSKICSMTPSGTSCGQAEVRGIGFPIFFGEMFSGDARVIGLNPINLLVNIATFYSVSCGIVLLYLRTKKETV